MHYLKGIAKSAIGSIIQDYFLIPLTEHDIATIIFKSNTNKETIGHTRIVKGSPTDCVKQNGDGRELAVISYLYKISLIEPEIEFRLLGHEPSLERLEGRIQYLRQAKEHLMEYMLEKYYGNLANMFIVLAYYENKKEIGIFRRKAEELRSRLALLSKAIEKTQMIARTNIRLKNIKTTLRLLNKIPNVTKMKLAELKQINLKTLYSQFQLTNRDKLTCLLNLQKYVYRIGEIQLYLVMKGLRQSINHYDRTVYEQTLKDFLVARCSVSYEKLFIGLLENEIRGMDEIAVHSVNYLYGRAVRYTKIMVNVHKIIRWHKENQNVNKCKVEDYLEEIGDNCRKYSDRNIIGYDNHELLTSINVSTNSSEYLYLHYQHEKDKQSNSTACTYSNNYYKYLMINSTNVKQHLCGVINRCLKDSLEDRCLIRALYDRMGQPYREGRALYYLYLFERMCSLGYTFAGWFYKETITYIKRQLDEHVYSVFNKHMRDLHERLSLEYNQYWSRLPVVNNFRCKNLEERVDKLIRLRQTQVYGKIFVYGFHFLKGEYKLIETWPTNKYYTWYIELLQLPQLRVNSQNYLISSNFTDEAILSQSAFRVLQYFYTYVWWLVELPMLRYHLYNRMICLIYYVLMTFLSSGLKILLFEEGVTIERKYIKKRLLYLYPNLIKLAQQYRNGINSSALQFIKYFNRYIRYSTIKIYHCTKARVVASYSCRFIINYCQHIIIHDNVIVAIDVYNKKIVLERIYILMNIQKYLMNMLYTECSQKIANMEMIKSVLKGVKWNYEYGHIGEYCRASVGFIKENFYKVRSVNKGEIPERVLYRIFALMWKTQLTLALKTFLEDRNGLLGGRGPRMSFEKFVDELFNGVRRLVRDEYHMVNAYRLMKSVVPILLANYWYTCKYLVKASFKNYEFIYSILMSLMYASECLTYSAPGEKESRREEIMKWLEEELLVEE